MKATSFATRQDLANFARLVTQGMSPAEALKYGDNGVGEWGDPCWKVDGDPICALPHPYTHNQQVSVIIPQLSGEPVICYVRDRSPDGIIDLNPCALKAFGLDPDSDIDYEGATVS